MDLGQASVFWPSIFIEQEPHTPSRQDLRKVSVGSMWFLIQISPSSTIGPQSLRSLFSSIRNIRMSRIEGVNQGYFFAIRCTTRTHLTASIVSSPKYALPCVHSKPRALRKLRTSVWALFQDGLG